VLFVLVAYRLLEPGSEWRLHRQWFERTALADLLGADFGLAEIHKLYRCHDRLLEHKQALFDHLTCVFRRSRPLIPTGSRPLFRRDVGQHSNPKPATVPI
jgi:hypothetical protein